MSTYLSILAASGLLEDRPALPTTPALAVKPKTPLPSTISEQAAIRVFLAAVRRLRNTETKVPGAVDFRGFAGCLREVCVKLRLKAPQFLNSSTLRSLSPQRALRGEDDSEQQMGTQQLHTQKVVTLRAPVIMHKRAAPVKSAIHRQRLAKAEASWSRSQPGVPFSMSPSRLKPILLPPSVPAEAQSPLSPSSQGEDQLSPLPLSPKIEDRKHQRIDTSHSEKLRTRPPQNFGGRRWSENVKGWDAATGKPEIGDLGASDLESLRPHSHSVTFKT
eukprot:CAMPEP_0184313914 /NCGR_PEP_ID=MMETSP1049-20130417/69030_1 /TAXON_ID=77928 /ORGANISM="Proteomonas sulcata, Strain CCMP704" /LENGTH=274 /DNA_ID=CAMNT_0026631517 /DNA_START=13 /DNA_END=837 /DNA_ORIENTATION=-